MSKYLINAVLFIAGLILGGFIIFLILGKSNQSQFADNYNLGLIETAYLLTELKGKNQDNLIKRLDENLPQHVLAINSNDWLKKSEHSKQALWSVKIYYQCSKTPIPKSINKILEELPPKPASSCSVKFKENK